MCYMINAALVSTYSPWPVCIRAEDKGHSHGISCAGHVSTDGRTAFVSHGGGSRRFLNTCTKTWIQRQTPNSFYYLLTGEVRSIRTNRSSPLGASKQCHRVCDERTCHPINFMSMASTSSKILAQRPRSCNFTQLSSR